MRRRVATEVITRDKICYGPESVVKAQAPHEAIQNELHTALATYASERAPQVLTRRQPGLKASALHRIQPRRSYLSMISIGYVL